MNRRVKVLLGLLGMTVVTAAAVAAPAMLRRMETFRVRRVEVLGTRYLAPHEALRASGISKQSSVFDAFDTWERALVNHSLVASVTIERKLPHTIRILIVEAEPIALALRAQDAGAGSLTPINEQGEFLTIDPSQVDLDLPVVAAPAPADRAQVAPILGPVLRTLVQIKLHEPAMYGWISDAEPITNAVRARLRAPAGAIVLLPANASPAQLRELRTALADLAARQDINRLIRIDARYHDQIVVALTPNAAAPL